MAQLPPERPGGAARVTGNAPNPDACRSESPRSALSRLMDLLTKAGDGNRTHTTSLEGWSSTIELRPRSPPPSTTLALNDTYLNDTLTLALARPGMPTSPYAPLDVVLSAPAHFRFLATSSLDRAAHPPRSGGRRIRTFEGYATRFTVWPL